MPLLLRSNATVGGQSPIGDGRASVLIFGSFRPTSVEGLVQTRLPILLTLPDAVPLARPHLYRRIGVKQSLALAAILAQQSWRVGVFKALQVKRAPQSEPITASRTHFPALALISDETLFRAPCP